MTTGTIGQNWAALSVIVKAVGILDPCMDFRIHSAMLSRARVFPGLRIKAHFSKGVGPVLDGLP